MTRTWITAALLSTALAAGCGGSSENPPESAPETATPAPAEAPAASPEVDTAPAPAPAPPAATSPSRPATRPPASAASPAPAPAPAPAAPAPQPQAPPAPRYRDVAAPVGTDLPLELTTAVSTETATVEDAVTARLRQSVIVDGVTVLPAGATIHGNVTEVERAGRVRGRSHLVLRFTEVTIDGRREPIRTNPLTFEGEATKGEDATKVGAGAGIGAVIGGILGGGSGAAKGAAIGGAAGAGTVLATRGRDVVLPVGAEITATLASPYEVRVEVR